MKLSREESVVIRLRYGIGVGDSMTYAEIGEVMGRSKTMVQQLEHRALRKLRHPSNRSILKEIEETVGMLENDKSSDVEGKAL